MTSPSFSCLLCRDTGLIITRVQSLGAWYNQTTVCPGDFRDGREQPCPASQGHFPLSRPEDVEPFLPSSWTATQRAQARMEHRRYEEWAAQEAPASYRPLIDASWGPEGPLPGMTSSLWAEMSRRVEVRRIARGEAPTPVVEGWSSVSAALSGAAPGTAPTEQPERTEPPPPHDPALILLALLEECGWPEVARESGGKLRRIGPGENAWRTWMENAPEERVLRAIEYVEETEERIAA